MHSLAASQSKVEIRAAPDLRCYLMSIPSGLSGPMGISSKVIRFARLSGNVLSTLFASAIESTVMRKMTPSSPSPGTVSPSLRKEKSNKTERSFQGIRNAGPPATGF